MDVLMPGRDLGAHLAHLVEHGEIRPVRRRGPPTGLSHGIHRTPGPLRVTPEQHHLVSTPSERDRRGQPDAGTAASHHYRAGHPLIRSS
jgi:hypothetical protein